MNYTITTPIYIRNIVSNDTLSHDELLKVYQELEDEHNLVTLNIKGKPNEHIHFDKPPVFIMLPDYRLCFYVEIIKNK